jgi:hypothetical protein
MKKFGLFLFLICCVLQASPNNFELFHEANQAFDKGDYELAEKEYKSLIGEGYESGDLHFNLANSYFKSGKLGLALFHFRKASELLPRDPDVKFNLSYAREKVPDQVENKESLFSRFFRILDSLTEKEAYFLFSAAFLALLICVIATLYRKNDGLKLTRNGLAVAFLLSCLVITYHSFFREKFGVITNPEVKVYSGVGKDNVVLFTLHEGVEFSVADTVDNDWVRIQLSDGKQGWVKTENIVFDKNS